MAHSYNRNGTLFSITNYSKGNIHGLYEEFDYGKMDMSGYYTEGKLNGPYKLFYADGSVSEEGYYEDGEYENIKSEYSISGKLSNRYKYSGDN